MATNEPQKSGGAGAFGRFMGFVLALALVVGVIWLALALLPHSVPTESNPHWLDLIVDNRWVVWLIRLMGLALMVMFAIFSIYFVRSLNHRMKQGHWLKSGAGLEAEIVSDALEDLEPLIEELAEAQVNNEELEGQLSASNEAIQQLLAILNEIPASEVAAAAQRADEKAAAAKEAVPPDANQIP